VAELDSQASGRSQELRRRRPAYAQCKQKRDGLLDVGRVHLAAAELLPPGIGDLDRHKAWSEEGRVSLK
jgi:hypothetical protein